MPVLQYDFLVIGTGIAGLYFSLEASRLGSVLMISKGAIEAGATPLAQGGVAASLSPSDSPEEHLKDTLEAGAGLCDPESVKVLVYEGVECIRDLISKGMNFTLNDTGSLDLGQEGGHSRPRIIHSKDHTGQDIHTLLVRLVRENPAIEVLENHYAIDLITEHHVSDPPQHPEQCYGAYALNTQTNTVSTILAGYTCLATGGAGRIYPYTTNPAVSTGDGIAMAYRAGCRIRNMEFIQFHPTALYTEKTGRAFLISEAVRGMGAKLTLIDGSTFMENYHPKAELAPRDIVARAIDTEIKKSGDPYVLLNTPALGAERIQKELPLIYRTLLEEHQIDMTKQAVPVVPAAHYICGGILTDLHARTDLKRLFAIGETASTGVHGANRLASNSLLESLVFARCAVQSIESGQGSQTKTNNSPPPPPEKVPEWKTIGEETFQSWGVYNYHLNELRHTMWDYIGIVRSTDRLNRALKKIDIIYEEVRELYKRVKLNSKILDLRNMALTAQLVIRSAVRRKESRGLHFMSDYPENRNASRQDTILQPSLHPDFPAIDR